MKNKTTKYIIGLLLMVVLAVTIARPVQASNTERDAVLHWNSIMIEVVIPAPPLTPQPAPASFVYGAYVQAAVYNAVVAIKGGYQPYGAGVTANPDASVDAAVATAAYRVLVRYFQAQQATLDLKYSTFMADIPEGAAKTAGIEVGNLAAQQVIESRTNDGLNANIGFVMPSPAPGVWQLPAGANPLVPWMSKLRPFMMESPDQFRPEPPPALNSNEWARQYNEVSIYGRSDSKARSAEQTAIAKFWAPTPLPQFNRAYQGIAISRDLSAMETARLMAMGNTVAADALVGCFDAKYHYLFWRPVFAIAQGEMDGNPKTKGDSSFAPLLGTPPHPEYPSAHSCLTSSQAEVFAKFLGTQHIGVTIPSTVQNVPARYYATASDLTNEIINARVWAGIHYRVSDETGADLGRKVAHWTLKRYFLPEN